jgi:CPA2 family monovalent cation:H+ antiporter-2
MNDLLLRVSLMCLLILLLTFVLKKFSQPYLVAYILAGVLMGPYFAGVLTEVEDTASIGELGILLLMFFLGMELDIPDRRSLLIKPVIAQLMRMLMSIGLVAIAGYLLRWPLITVVLIGTLFIFNSTAVVSEYLRKNGELHSGLGRMILNILLLQDVSLAPVLTLFPLLSGEQIPAGKMAASAAGCVIIFLLLRSIRNRDFFQPGIQKLLGKDHELQVFAGSFICLGFGLIAELAGLSGAVGSFLAGMMVGRLDAFQWLERTLSPFKVFFVAFFFVSVGLRLDLAFLSANQALILAGTLVLFLVNSVLSAFVLRCCDTAGGKVFMEAHYCHRPASSVYLSAHWPTRPKSSERGFLKPVLPLLRYPFYSQQSGSVYLERRVLLINQTLGQAEINLSPKQPNDKFRYNTSNTLPGRNC